MNTNITNDDRANLASAERVGNIGVLDNAVLAMEALIDVLDDDGMEARHTTREGLYAALRLVSESLSERAGFLRDQQETLGFGKAPDNHNREIEE
jgi:hypothetical protein